MNIPDNHAPLTKVEEVHPPPSWRHGAKEVVLDSRTVTVHRLNQEGGPPPLKGVWVVRDASAMTTCSRADLHPLNYGCMGCQGCFQRFQKGSSGSSHECRRGGHAQNATKQGVSDRFRVFLPLRPLHLLEKNSILRTVFHGNFSVCYYFLLSEVRTFEELGLADRGAWRKEIPPTQQIHAFFPHPFSYPPLWLGEHNSGAQFLLYFGHCRSPNPSRQPLFETSDASAMTTRRGPGKAMIGTTAGAKAKSLARKSEPWRTGKKGYKNRGEQPNQSPKHPFRLFLASKVIFYFLRFLLKCSKNTL